MIPSNPTSLEGLKLFMAHCSLCESITIMFSMRFEYLNSYMIHLFAFSLSECLGVCQVFLCCPPSSYSQISEDSQELLIFSRGLNQRTSLGEVFYTTAIFPPILVSWVSHLIF